jgi:hypothetical protein
MPRLDVEIKDPQRAFLNRKKAELKRSLPPSSEGKVTDETIIQGMLSFYMALDAAERTGDDSRIRDVTR